MVCLRLGIARDLRPRSLTALSIEAKVRGVSAGARAIASRAVTPTHVKLAFPAALRRLGPSGTGSRRLAPA